MGRGFLHQFPLLSRARKAGQRLRAGASNGYRKRPSGGVINLKDGGDLAGCFGQAPLAGLFNGKLETVARLVTPKHIDLFGPQPVVGDFVHDGYLIGSGSDDQVAILFDDGTIIHLGASSQRALDELICRIGKLSNSTLFRFPKDAFGFFAGKMAPTRRLIFDTPSAQIRRIARGGSAGSLTFSALTIALIEKLQAASADIALLDNGTINYKDLKHGIFEIITKEAHPRHIFVDDPAITFVLRADGAVVNVEQVANSPARMAELQTAFQGV